MAEETKRREFPPNTIHVIRTAQQIHALLSQMADQKANMLLAATFVIFTIAIGQVRQTAEPLPLLILGGAAFVSAILAIFAVLPAADYRGPGPANLLFFGSFSQLDEAEFMDRVVATIEDEEAAFRLMLRDLYQNGRVLERKKYRLLGYAYRVFLIGLIASFAAFVAEYFV
ncbi:MAG TPA: Pycsar system effector family protein [Allosphingosinicella sp.]|nr:Pycsar system effector family protein [Allosphingosinicella sp.]